MASWFETRFALLTMRGESVNCSKGGDICDPAKKVCHAGCHANSDCPLEQICDPEQLVCVPGCDTTAKCSPGTICLDAECVPGCDADPQCQPMEECDLGIHTCVCAAGFHD